MNYKDAVREGDGDRIMIMWKYFMLIFKVTGRTNYALESQTLLSQYYVTPLLCREAEVVSFY